MAEDNGIRDLTALVTTHPAQLVGALGDQQKQANARWDALAARWDAMAARWDGYIVEQRQFNQRLQSILERLPPRGGANGGETAP